jgi:hypothetical protein
VITPNTHASIAKATKRIDHSNYGSKKSLNLDLIHLPFGHEASGPSP